MVKDKDGNVVQYEEEEEESDATPEDAPPKPAKKKKKAKTVRAGDKISLSNELIDSKSTLIDAE